MAVDGQEDADGEERDSFIAVDEGMVAGQSEGVRGGEFGEGAFGFVSPGVAGAVEGGLEETLIGDAACSAEAGRGFARGAAGAPSC